LSGSFRKIEFMGETIAFLRSKWPMATGTG
jgi:hypothetical protein